MCSSFLYNIWYFDCLGFNRQGLQERLKQNSTLNLKQRNCSNAQICGIFKVNVIQIQPK